MDFATIHGEKPHHWFCSKRKRAHQETAVLRGHVGSALGVLGANLETIWGGWVNEKEVFFSAPIYRVPMSKLPKHPEWQNQQVT